jgi:hypothetical protein
MNSSTADNPVQWLFLDLNAFFASCEQQETPALRGKPIIACAMALEGIVSKRADAAYAPGNRGLWLKVKCLHREEFVVVGWTA